MASNAFAGLSTLRAAEKPQGKKELSAKEKALGAYLAQQYGAPAPEGVEVKKKRKKKREAGAGGPGVVILDEDVSGFKPLEQARERVKGSGAAGTGGAAVRASFVHEHEEEEDVEAGEAGGRRARASTGRGASTSILLAGRLAGWLACLHTPPSRAVNAPLTL